MKCLNFVEGRWLLKTIIINSLINLFWLIVTETLYRVKVARVAELKVAQAPIENYQINKNRVGI